MVSTVNQFFAPRALMQAMPAGIEAWLFQPAVVFVNTSTFNGAALHPVVVKMVVTSKAAKILRYTCMTVNPSDHMPVQANNLLIMK